MEQPIYLFSPSIVLLGVIDEIIGMVWIEKFADAGSFELWAPLTENSITYLQEDNLIWLGGDSAGVIEFKESTIDESGNQSIHIKGRLCESYLDYRTIYPIFQMTGYRSDVLRALVNTYLINPTDTDRKIPTIELYSGQATMGETISYQATGGSVLLESTNLCEVNNLGFRLIFNPRTQKLTYRIYQGLDRTINQSINPPVVLSSEMDDILSSGYTQNKSELRNVAYVEGEDSGSSHRSQVVGTASGVFRRELYIDAKDIRSEDSSGFSISDAEYNQMLQERGKTKLKDYKHIENFAATIRLAGITGNVYNQDYFLGDQVTVYDSRLRVRVDAMVTAVTTTYDSSGKTLDITFGYSQPTLADKLKRRTE